jgi:hypothetical protein
MVISTQIFFPWRCDKVGIFLPKKSFVKVALQPPHSFFLGLQVMKFFEISDNTKLGRKGEKEVLNYVTT